MPDHRAGHALKKRHRLTTAAVLYDPRLGHATSLLLISTLMARLDACRHSPLAQAPFR